MIVFITFYVNFNIYIFFFIITIIIVIIIIIIITIIVIINYYRHEIILFFSVFSPRLTITCKFRSGLPRMFLEVGEEMQVHCQWFVNS